MKRFHIAILAALCGLSHPAMSADVNVQLTEISVNGKVEVEYLVSSAVLARQPRWDDRKGEPPLPQAQVVRIARVELSRRGIADSTVELSEVSVSRIATAGLSNIWYYTVSFSPISGGRRTPYWDLKVLFLMDGTVVNASPVKPR